MKIDDHIKMEMITKETEKVKKMPWHHPEVNRMKSDDTRGKVPGSYEIEYLAAS